MRRYLPAISVLVLGICLGAAAVQMPAFAQEKETKASAMWEYKVSLIQLRATDAESRLNYLAEQGWEPCLIDTQGRIVFRRALRK